jgi:hypothetical protein
MRPDPTTPRPVWQAHLVAAVVLLAVTVGFFWPVVSRSEMYSTLANSQTVHYPWAAAGDPFAQVIQSDQAHLSHPWQVALTDALRDEGTIPLWNASSWAGGAPLFANGSSGQVYPPRLVLALTVGPVSAHEIFSFLHLFLAGLCAYALARELRMGWWAGLASGLTWMCSGWVLAWLHLEVVAPTFVFLPLLIALVHRTVERPGVAWTAVTAVAGATYLISGHVLFELITFLVAFGYGAALIVARLREGPPAEGRAAARHAAARLAVTALAAGGLAAVVLVPTALALRDSPRQSLSAAELRDQRTAHPTELVRLAWPDDLPVDADEIHFQPFVGLAATALAAIGFTRRRRPGVGLGRTLVVVGLLAAMSTPLLWVLSHLPGFGVFRPPARYSLWATMGLVVLVGLGVDWCVERITRWRSARVAAVTVGAVVVLNTVQLLAWGWRVNEATFWPRDAANALPVTPIVEAVTRTASGWPERVVPVTRAEPGDGFYPEVLGRELATALGVETASGYESTLPGRTVELLRVLTGEPVDDVIAEPGLVGAYAPFYASPAVRLDLADRLGISLAYLSPFLAPDDPAWGGASRPDDWAAVEYEGTDGSLVRLEGWGAGPQLVAGVEVVADDEAGLRRFVDADFDYRARVVLTEAEAERAGVAASGAGSGEGTVTASEMGINSARIELETDGPMWLVVPVSWDPGWSATVDGRSAEVRRGDHQRVVVAVSAGASVVELRYRPPGLVAGAAISVVSAVALGVHVTAVAVRRRAERQRGVSSSTN